MSCRVGVASLAFGCLALIGARPSPNAASYKVPLSGSAETNIIHPTGGSGDMRASGTVKLTLDPESRLVCYNFKVAHLGTPLMAQIERGSVLHNGPTVVTLFTGPGAPLSDCRIWNQDRLAEIVSRPAAFYVNLYTTDFPDGALRGQLVLEATGPIQIADARPPSSLLPRG